MLLEPKAPELYPGIETELDKELRSLPAFNAALRADRVQVQSFNHAWLRSYADLAPDVPVGLLYGTRPTAADIASAATWADAVNPALGAIDEATVDAVHDAGMTIDVWTVNAGQDMRRAIRLGRRRRDHQLPAGAARHRQARLTPGPPVTRHKMCRSPGWLRSRWRRGRGRRRRRRGSSRRW